MTVARHVECIDSLNQPAASRDYQSVFHNMSVYDRYFYETMFGSFAFPDGTIIKYDDFAPLQELFLEWLLEERKKALLTFPVLTEASLNEGEQPKDMDFARMIANLRSRGLSMFSYNDSRASALASCCFGGDQKVLTNSSETGIVLRAIKDIVEGDYNTYRKNFTVFHNGAWCQAKAVKEQKRTMFEVETVNGKRLVVTDNHIHPTISGEKTTVQLTTDDYLMFNTMALDAIPERDEHLTYEQGLLIGLYAGDGSRYSRKNCDSKCVTFSLNTGKKSAAIEDIQSALDQWNVVESIHTHTKGKALAVNITSSRLFEITKKYVTGEYAHEKAFNLGNILSQNKEFRRGIIDGWYMSDGGNSNRIYSTSYDLIETGEAIMTSLGIISSIDTVDRRNEGVVINGETFNRNFKTHCIRWYDNKNKRSMANIFIVKNNSMFFKIKSIKQIDYEDEHVYCFEMKNENEPYFTLPNGIITHNCRLRNEFDENEFTTTLGSPSEQTGSTNVITINMHRVVYERLDIDELVRKVHKFHLAHRALVDEYVSAGLLPAYTAGYISTKKQFCTIGINGLNEAAEYLGHTCNNNEPYKKWLAETLSTFKRLNKKATKEYGVKFNSEVVPGESLGIKNANWDKKAGLQVNRDCYNSYFYLPDDNQISIIDKFILHGGEIAESCDGGQALHLNIAKLPDEEFFLWLRHLAAKYKTLYWTTNVMTSCCNGCGMNSLDTVDTCPHCGSEDISYATRVIGYCRKIENYSEGRKKEAATRFYH